MSFFKKRSCPDGETEALPKRVKQISQSTALNPYPKKIIQRRLTIPSGQCWNCNGLSPRLKVEKSVGAIKRFIVERSPDVLFLSEVRLPASHNGESRKPPPDAIIDRSQIRASDSISRADFNLVNQLLQSPACAHYKTYFSLSDTKYAGTAMLLNTRTTELPVSVRFNLGTMDVNGSVHDSDGRVIIAKFSQFSILHTYVPNNGWSDKQFERRRRWDENMLSFMRRKRDAGVKVLWVGDLNIAPADCDLTHPHYFRRQSNARGTNGLAPENVGQPGCTDAERQRFSKILEAGDMADAYRHLHDDISTGDMTWRGAIGSKYGDKGMRIDHCIAPRCLLPKIEDVQILGQASKREGFMGSDHCPLLILCSDGIEVNSVKKVAGLSNVDSVGSTTGLSSSPRCTEQT